MNAMLNLFARENLISTGYAVALLLLLTLTAALVWQFMVETRRDAPRLESHWGGLGGGLGGWELSRSLVYLIAAISFAILTVTVLRQANEDLNPASKTSTPPPDPGGSPVADRKGGATNTTATAPSAPAKPGNASAGGPSAISGNTGGTSPESQPRRP